MSVCMCECYIGCDGSPCAHQFVLWSENTADSVNFVPFTSTDEHQRLARIAIGKDLQLTIHEPLYSSVRNEVDVVDFFSENNDLPSQVKHLTLEA